MTRPPEADASPRRRSSRDSLARAPTSGRRAALSTAARHRRPRAYIAARGTAPARASAPQRRRAGHPPLAAARPYLPTAGEDPAELRREGDDGGRRERVWDGWSGSFRVMSSLKGENPQCGIEGKCIVD